VTPYYERDGITIYHGDALDVLSSGALPPISGIVADPPYCSGGRQQSAARQVFDKNGARTGDWFLTDNMGTDTYIWWLRQIGRRLFDASEVGAHFYCFTDWRQYGNVVVSNESVGWSLKTCVVWDKMRGGAMGSFWRNDHEFIACFSKGQPTPLPNGSFFNVLHATKPQGGEHPTVKPDSVIRRLIEAVPDGVILDPFMGSGTTMRAAADLGRRAIGIEIEERYCEIAARRLEQLALPLEAVS